MIISPAAVLFGVLVASPTLWGTLMQDTVPVDVAFWRFIVILLVGAVGWTAVQKLVSGFVVPVAPTTPDPDGRVVSGAVEPDRRAGGR